MLGTPRLFCLRPWLRRPAGSGVSGEGEELVGGAGRRGGRDAVTFSIVVHLSCFWACDDASVAGLRGGTSPPRAESEVEEQVFLAADHRPATGFDEQVAGVDSDVGGDALGVQEEARIHA